MNRQSLPEKVIYVYSGKGGVGKSTVCVNLAYAMALQGAKVGLFDGDLSGPSIPTMVQKIELIPPKFDNFRIIPGKYGEVYVNSIGFISEPIEGGYWHGRYLEGVLNQMLLDTDWQGINTLVIDMPPGTGELHREIFSRVRGKVVIVTTPQDLSYADTIRAIEMLERMRVDILGVVENMSYYICKCGERVGIFQGNTEETLCKPFGLELLGKIPINMQISTNSNQGIPFVVDSEISQQENILFRNFASRIISIYDEPISRRNYL